MADGVACNISDILLWMTGLIIDLQVKTMANEVAKCGIEYTLAADSFASSLTTQSQTHAYMKPNT